jgi:nitric oxide reductase NorQ protein
MDTTTLPDIDTLNVAQLRKLVKQLGIGNGAWRVQATRDELTEAVRLGRVAAASANAQLLVVPDIDKTFVVSDIAKTLLEAVLKIPNGKIRNVLLTGPAGCGKTDLARYTSAIGRAPFFEFNLVLYREPIDIFGEKGVANGQTFFAPSEFVRAIETPGAVILLDEVNRATPPVWNALMPLLDHRKEVHVEGLQRIVRVADNVTFIGTANIGAQFTGTYRLDEALESRFPYHLEVNYLTRKEESKLLSDRCGIKTADANALATVAETIRAKASGFGGTLSKAVSTRQLLAAGWLIAMGMTPGQAMNFTVVPKFDTEGGESSERAQVLQTIQLTCGL